MRRRDFTIGLLLAAGPRLAPAQEPTKYHRIAIVIPAGFVAAINETSSDPLLRQVYRPFFEELRRLGHVEDKTWSSSDILGKGGQNAFLISLARSPAVSPT
jgi:hypothetical protein